MAEEKQPGTDIVDWEEQLRAMTLATQEAEKPKGQWFSFKGGQLTFNEMRMKDDKAPVVVIMSIFENQWYKNRYDPNNPESPACYAFAEVEDELAPHPDAPEPQAATCAECPKNEWKSDPGGGKGKACKNVRRLALMSATPDDLASPEAVSKADIGFAKIPVTSVRNWSAYASQIANVLRIPPIAVVSEISVAPDPKVQLQVNWQLLDRIDTKTLMPALLQRRKEIQPTIFAPYDVVAPGQQQQPAQNKKY